MNQQINRRRVVMLVDNGVHGDSRVQKAARSAADAGWDVTLLGKSPDGREHTWSLGDATVRLIPVPARLNKRRHEYRRRWRVPLAYPPNGIAEQRTQWVKAWQADIAVRKAEGKQVQAASAASEALRLWVWFRSGQLRWANRSRKPLTEPWDKAYTWFWSKAMGVRAWRRLEPALWDWELAFGPVIDGLKPDLIHAHDFRMLGVGARSKVRLAAKGRTAKLVWDAHEFVPGLGTQGVNARWLPSHVFYEREYAPYADGVITVSERLAEMLRDGHGLAELPTVVSNTPNRADVDPSAFAGKGLREVCGLAEDVPLLVYSGAAAPQRGIDTPIEALPKLAGVHLALVVNKPDSPYVQGLLKRAKELHVADRVHLTTYVPSNQVVGFLSSADAGISPNLHYANHEISLNTKFYEYGHARLPLIVSDVKTIAEAVESIGQGEVYPAGDADGFARAAQAVLADPKRYRAAYDQPGLLDEWTWETQATAIDRTYTSLLGTRS